MKDLLSIGVLGLPLFLLSGCITVECPCAHGVAPAATAAVDRQPPPALELAAIPVRAELLEEDGDAVVAFEVDGDELLSVAYHDRAAAEAALELWRELVFRIPTNQRLDLVQLEITRGSDPAGSTDNSGTGGRAGRFGAVLSFSRDLLAEADSDPAAPLSGRRGTFDWTLVHEFAHLRTYVDGAVDDYIAAFGTETGPGSGYPADGSPRLDGSWVSSYAERAGGDEDCAESFTAYVMLGELPAGDSLAARKVRWFADRPGYPALRRALRVTEPDGSAGPVPPAPRVTYPLEVEPPTWMHGTWRGERVAGIQVEYRITSDDIVRIQTEAGRQVELLSHRDLRDTHPLALVDLYETSDDFYLHQVSFGGRSVSESFRRVRGGVVVEHELLGEFTVHRE